jgi:mutator protein MutT
MPPIEIAIAVVARNVVARDVLTRKREFLIGQRPAGVPLAGLWEFPGGKLLPGETPAAAAARECQEETGLSIQVGEPYPAVVHDYDHGRLLLHFFACRPVDPDQLPLDPFRWVARDRLMEYSFPAANTRLVEWLVAGG